VRRRPEPLIRRQTKDSLGPPHQILMCASLLATPGLERMRTAPPFEPHPRSSRKRHSLKNACPLCSTTQAGQAPAKRIHQWYYSRMARSRCKNHITRNSETSLPHSDSQLLFAQYPRERFRLSCFFARECPLLDEPYGPDAERLVDSTRLWLSQARRKRSAPAGQARLS
jgi:hypothetical protein